MLVCLEWEIIDMGVVLHGEDQVQFTEKIDRIHDQLPEQFFAQTASTTKRWLPIQDVARQNKHGHHSGSTIEPQTLTVH